ncbi:unnamed protein product, partial [marine sediment metagenome]
EKKYEEYKPFGNEWRSEVMKMSKDELVTLYKKVCIENQKILNVVNRELVEIAPAMHKFLSDLTKYPESISSAEFQGVKEEAWKIIKEVK